MKPLLDLRLVAFSYLLEAFSLPVLILLFPDRLANMDKAVEYSVHVNDGDDVALDEGVVLGEKTGTVADRDAMARLGKDQLFKVRLNQSI